KKVYIAPEKTLAYLSKVISIVVFNLKASMNMKSQIQCALSYLSNHHQKYNPYTNNTSKNNAKHAKYFL
ncbi:hypothetical protein CGI98_24410, partial [Vibrio parahaemolyticus]